jgi:hypothetical protein
LTTITGIGRKAPFRELLGFPSIFPETTSGLNLAVTMLTRHKHQCPAIKNP